MGELVPQRPSKPPQPKRNEIIAPPPPEPQPSSGYRSILRQGGSRSVNDELIKNTSGESAYELVEKSQPSVGAWTNVLYPYELLQAYHAVRVRGDIVSEEYCDKLLHSFMAAQDKQRYLGIFKTAMTNKIFMIIMHRVLVGTMFEDSNGSKLPNHLRPVALRHLGIHGASVEGAMQQLEEVNSLASHEEMILGRIGYLMIWQSGLDPALIAPTNFRLPG